MASDKSLTKNYSGTFAGGQGPVLGQTVSPVRETKSLFGGEGKDIGTVDGPVMKAKDGSEGANFDLHGASYKGPGNWEPENKGVANPDDIHS